MENKEQEVCNNCGKTIREQLKGCAEITCYRQFLSKQSTNPMENKLCCDVLPKLFNKINWFSYNSQGVQIFNMPHFITNEGERLRINHCPSCGTAIRSIEIEEADYIEFKKLAL